VAYYISTPLIVIKVYSIRQSNDKNLVGGDGVQEKKAALIAALNIIFAYPGKLK